MGSSTANSGTGRVDPVSNHDISQQYKNKHLFQLPSPLSFDTPPRAIMPPNTDHTLIQRRTFTNWVKRELEAVRVR